MAVVEVGELTEMMSLQLVLPAVLTLIGLGFVVVYAMRDKLDANWAKVFFVAAAVYWTAKVIVWGAKTSHGFWFRFVVAFALTGLAGAFVIEAWRLVSQKHEQQQPLVNQQQSNSFSPTVLPSPEPAPFVAVSSSPSAKPSSTPRPSNKTSQKKPPPPDDGEDILFGRKKP